MSDINTIEAYNKFARYYDLYVGNFKDDLNLYHSLADKDEKILEVGCGTGRVLKYLLDNGYKNITGVDISEKMLEIAKNKLSKYLIEKRLALGKHNFHAESLKGNFKKVFITFYTINYVLDNPIKFLRNIGLSMETNSLIALDLFYPRLFWDPESDNVWLERELKLENGKIVILRDKRSFDGRFEKRTQVFVEEGQATAIETTRRFYSKEEMEQLLVDAGFQNVKSLSGYAVGDVEKFTDEYPMLGFNEFNVDMDKYINREEVKPNFVLYANRFR